MMRRLFLVWLVLGLLAITRCGNEPGPTPGPTPQPGVKSVLIGTPALVGHTYKWYPVEGLSNPNIAQPLASPKKTTVYTVTAITQCGSATAKMTLHVFGEDGKEVL